MKEYQDYAPQEQQKNGFSQPLQPAETIPMTQYQEQQPPAYQQQGYGYPPTDPGMKQPV